MASLLIGDGFDFAGEVPARKGLPALKFKYRPALTETLFDYDVKNLNAQTGKEKTNALIDLLIKQVGVWDVVDSAGNSVPVTKENLAKIPEPYLVSMLETVLSYAKKGKEGEDQKN